MTRSRFPTTVMIASNRQLTLSTDCHSEIDEGQIHSRWKTCVSLELPAAHSIPSHSRYHRHYWALYGIEKNFPLCWKRLTCARSRRQALEISPSPSAEPRGSLFILKLEFAADFSVSRNTGQTAAIVDENILGWFWVGLWSEEVNCDCDCVLP